MGNEVLGTLAIALGLAQVALALFWWRAAPRQPVAQWFAAMLGLFGLANGLDGLVALVPPQARSLATLYAIVTPILPFMFVGGLLSLVRSAWEPRRLRRAVLGALAVTLFFAAGDTLLGTGMYFRLPEPPANPALLVSYLSGPLREPISIVFVRSMASLAIVWLLWRVARQARRRERAATFAQEAILLATLVLAMAVRFALEPFVPESSTELLSNFTMTAGLLAFMLNATPAVVEQLGRLVADQPVRRKLGLGFGALLALTVLVGVLSLMALYQLNRQVQQTLTDQRHLTQEAATLLEELYESRGYEQAFAVQARSQGLGEARRVALARWQRDTGEATETLAHLVADPLTPDERAQVAEIERLFPAYLASAQALFRGYEQRGDREEGALAAWLASAAALDQRLNESPIADPAFSGAFVGLRTAQFRFLARETAESGAAIRGIYSDLRRTLLFGDLAAPDSDVDETVRLLGNEAAAFESVRAATDRLGRLAANVDGAAEPLEGAILRLADQASADFGRAAQSIGQSQSLYLALILGSVVVGVLLAYTFALVVARQIARPVLALAAAADRMASGDTAARVEESGRDELGVAAGAFNTMAGRLQALLATLEERVARRTAQLATAAEVAAAASAVRELQRLLDSTTALLVERFGDIYHAQVFLVDQQGAGEWAVLRASTGEPGRQLLARRHRLGVGSRSVIGQVTATGQYVLARVADPSSVHKPNELLPDTKTELALPMRRGDRTIGALDVQSLRHYAFSEDDIGILQTLADQLTIAVENARLFGSLGATVQETEQLFRASSRIAAATNPTELFGVLLDEAATVEGLDRLTIGLFDEWDADRQPLSLQAVHSWSRAVGYQQSGLRLPLSAHGSRWLQGLRAEPDGYEVPDLHADTSVPDEVRRLFAGLGVRGLLALPLESAGELQGFVVLQRHEPELPPAKAARVFRVLAQQAGVALNRFALLEQLAGRVDELQALRQSFLALPTAAPLGKLLGALAARAATLGRASRAFLYLHRETEGAMALVAAHPADPARLGSLLHAGEGAAGTILARRAPFAVPSYAAWDGQADPDSTFRDVGAVAAVPLLLQNRLLGAVVVANRRAERRFNDDDLRRLTLFADQAALTIENARLLEETARGLQESASLYATAEALLGATTEPELLDALARHLPIDTNDIVVVARESDLAQAGPTVAAVNQAQLVVRERPERITRRAADLFPPGSPLPPALLAAPDGAEAGRIVADLPATLGGRARPIVELGLRAMMSAPIETRQGRYGAILLFRRGDVPFQPDDLARVTTAAAQFAVARDNLRLVEESQRAAAQLATAAGVSRAVSAQLDLDRVLTEAVTLLQGRFGYYHVQVFLVDEARLWAELRASTGPVGEQMLARRHRLGVGSRSVIGQVTARGQAILARSAEVDPTTIHRRNELLPDTRTEFALPMALGGQVIGALDVQSVDPAAFRDEADQQLLQSLADQLAVAVQNARLFEASQRGLAQSQTLYRVGQALSEAQSLDEVLRAIHDHVAPPDLHDLSILAVELDADGTPTHLRVEAIVVPHQPGLSLVGHRYAVSRQGNALVSAIGAGREAIVIHDVATESRLDARSRQAYLQLHIPAFVAVPLPAVEGQPMFLQLSLRAARHISPQEVAQLSTVGAQAATVIANLNLLARLEERVQQTQALYRASRAINEAATVSEIAAAIAAHLVERPQATVVLLSLSLDANEQLRSVQVEGGFGPEPRGRERDLLRFSAATLPVLRSLDLAREPLAIGQLGEYPRLSPRERRLFRGLGIAALMTVPVRLANGWAGAILVSYPTAQRFAPDEVERLAAVATQAATTLQNRDLLRQTQASLHEAEALRLAGAAIGEAESLEALLAALVPLAGPMEPDQAVLLLFDEPVLEGERPIRFTPIAGVTRQRELLRVGQPFRVRDFPILRRLPVTEPLVFPDIQGAETVSRDERAAMAALHLRSLLYLPLRLGTRYLGWIGFHAARPQAIPEPTVLRLQTIVQQAAIALQSQQLFEEAQRRAWREEQISRITARLHASSAPEEIMRVGLQELQRALHVQRALGWMDPGEGNGNGNGR